jgi:hypothetical protein
LVRFNLTESSPSQLAPHLSSLLTASALLVHRRSSPDAGLVVVVRGHSPRHVLKSGFAFFLSFVLHYAGAGFDPSSGDGAACLLLLPLVYQIC